ncbi:MAG TPA: hypothetical protein VHL58_05730 [Thermoanaerobaculia bacterium]|nr:hypothetical protein [Thermoanaerobaculia bacterium]
MHLPEGLTPAEIRVLQEYRRMGKQELSVDEIKAIRHPVGGGEAPAALLAGKGYLKVDTGRSAYALTEIATEFLSFDPKPMFEHDEAGE